MMLIVAGVLSGCGSHNDLEFSEAEKNHFSALHEGDTIYYESSTHDLDTILISHCGSRKGEASLPDNNLLWFEIKHLPVDKWQTTSTDSAGNIKIDDQIFLWVDKHPSLSPKIEYSINYRDFQSDWHPFDSCYTDTLILNGQKITNYYIVRCDSVLLKRLDEVFDEAYKEGYKEALKSSNPSSEINDTDIVLPNYSAEPTREELIADSMRIEILYWTDKDGLIAYKNKRGEVWIKK